MAAFMPRRSALQIVGSRIPGTVPGRHRPDSMARVPDPGASAMPGRESFTGIAGDSRGMLGLDGSPTDSNRSGRSLLGSRTRPDDAVRDIAAFLPGCLKWLQQPQGFDL
ncbi:hypothetical protein VTN77DRAFT_9895 [Rasamsonia byssochlamydoides]|uniref:uncharacterized protein n=1 Tax=Rasamsonia byssochlamydoides TaxID=89139 RepID=UPI00374383D3